MVGFVLKHYARKNRTTQNLSQIAALSITSMKPFEEFCEIIQTCKKKLDETSDFQDVIPFGESLIKLISENESLRGKFSDEFVRYIDRSSISHEPLIEFCAHKLKWPETKLALEALSRDAVDRNNWNAITRIHGVLDAFASDWPDASDLYSDYFNAKNT